MISPLRAKRFFAQMSIYDLSVKTGIDPARISLIEREYKTPRDDEKEKLAKALGCGVGEIFPENRSSESKTPNPWVTGGINQ